MKKNNNKNHFLVLSLIVFFSFSISILIFSPVSFVNIAKALNPSDYNKATGDSLGVIDWNRLDADFFAKSGDTMQGDIDMNNNQINNLPNPITNDQVANKAYVDSTISTQVAAIPPTTTNTGGVPLDVVCGQSTPAEWQTYIPDANTVYVDVDMTAAGFTSSPKVFTSLYGTQQHWKTYGATSIYDLTPTSFRIYVYSAGLAIDALTVQGWGWGIYWCAYGN